MSGDRKSFGMPPPMEREGTPLPRQSPDPLPPGVPAPGEMIAAKYEVERVLGVGGMGVVIAARHVHLGQRVAMKFMRGEAARDDNAVGRFLREARAAVALSSEHVARVLDVGTLESGAPYMVMEYLSGVDLAQVLRRDGPMPVSGAVDVVLQACEAIAEAHALGIVHRDLKPANLFVTSRMDGSPLVKVLDFGISKAAQVVGSQSGQSLTASGIIMGSPGYMSPEQVRSSKDVDARSDIWSVGVILYELLTGISPFVGETLGDTFAKIASENPPPIRERRPDVPAKLVATIDQCLQRRLDARIQSIGALAARLVEFAPPEAAVVAARIARVSDPRAGSPRQETLAAPSTISPKLDPRRAARSVADETGRGWLRSAARPRREGARVVLGFLGGSVLVCAALGAYWGLTRTPRGAESVAAGRPPASIASAPSVSSVPPPGTPPAMPPTGSEMLLVPKGAPISASDQVTSPVPSQAPDAGRATWRHAPEVGPPKRATAAPPPRMPSASPTPTPAAPRPPPAPSSSSTATTRHETDLL